MCLDEVAADFPSPRSCSRTRRSLAQDEAISICLHKANVWIDLSGWSPKYFPPQLVQYANTQLKTKVLFGSDFPMITPDRWLADFEQAAFKDEVRPGAEGERGPPARSDLRYSSITLLGTVKAQASSTSSCISSASIASSRT